MSIPLYFPALIQPTRHARNGHFPNTAHYAQCISAQGHILGLRKKEVYAREVELGPAHGVADNWRFRFRTGYGTRALRFTALMGLATNNDPYVTIALTKVGGATTNIEVHRGSAQGSITDAPEDWSPQYAEVDVDEASAYTALVTRSGSARLLSLTVEELGWTFADESHTYQTDFLPTAGAPILDDDIDRLIEGSSNMLRHNGALIAHWHKVDGSAVTRTNSTPASIFDGTTTGTPSSTAAGWRFVTSNRNTRSSSVVKVEFHVYGSMAGGSATARLITTDGSTTASITINSSTPQWWTATGDLVVGTGQLYVPQLAGNGLQTCSILAAGVLEYNP